jgi:hypothetical protein
MAVEIEVDHARGAGEAVQLEDVAAIRNRGAADDGAVRGGGLLGQVETFADVEQPRLRIDPEVAVVPDHRLERVGLESVPDGDLGQPMAERFQDVLRAGGPGQRRTGRTGVPGRLREQRGSEQRE